MMLAQEAKSAREAAVAAKPVHVRLGRVKQRLEQAEHKERERRSRQRSKLKPGGRRPPRTRKQCARNWPRWRLR